MDHKEFTPAEITEFIEIRAEEFNEYITPEVARSLPDDNTSLHEQ